MVEARAGLRLTWSSLFTPVLAFCLLAAVLSIAEVMARSNTARTRLPAASIGSSHRQFEIQLSKLDALVRNEGPLDCLIIGSSVAFCGIDPQVVSAGYRERVGRDLRCFTFGINGMDATVSGLMSEVLVQRYHPWLLIFDTTAGDYIGTASRPARGSAAIEATPWVQYMKGTWTITGWLTEHLYAYRLYLTHRGWRQSRYWRDLLHAQRIEQRISAYGFSSPMRYRPARRAHQQIPGEYNISPDAREGLARIARLHQHGLRVILVESPLQKSAIEALPQGEHAYRMFVDAVEAFASAQSIPFWRTRPLALIPDDGWRDARHLNGTGARRLSQWLAEQLAAQEVGPYSPPPPASVHE